MRKPVWMAAWLVLGTACATPLRVDVSRLSRSVPPPTAPDEIEFFAAPDDIPYEYRAVAVVRWSKGTRRNLQPGLARVAAERGANALVFGFASGAEIEVTGSGQALVVRYVPKDEER